VGDPVIVLTDSVYLIRGITQWIFGWQKRGWKNAEGADILNRDLWEQLAKVSRGKKIDWRYVAGHSGFAGNERVDELAVAQSKKRPISGYTGPLAGYRIGITPLPEKVPLPEMRKMNGDSKDKATAFYLSLVNGVLENHSAWDQCQARVKGVSQARFKKVTSEAEAMEVLKSWGLDPRKQVLKR
jgi:ribonuclease HI